LTLSQILNFTASNSNIDAQLKVSYIEIYNENVNDLLNIQNKNLLIRDVKDQGTKSIIIPNLTETIVTSAEEAYDLFQRGEKLRKFAETCLNDNSSRSHTIFML